MLPSMKNLEGSSVLSVFKGLGDKADKKANVSEGLVQDAAIT